MTDEIIDMREIIDKPYNAVLTYQDGHLEIMPEGDMPDPNAVYADNPLVAVSLLQSRGRVRMPNMTAEIEDKIRYTFEVLG